MEGAPQAEQCVVVIRATVQLRRTGTDGFEYLVGFFEKYIEHFAVGACACAGCGRLCRHNGGSGLFIRRGLHRRHRLGEQHKGVVAGPLLVTGEEHVDRALGGQLAVLARLKIKTQTAKALGDPFDVLVQRSVCRIRAALDQTLAHGGQTRRALLVGNQKHAAHLAQGRHQWRQGVVLGAVARKGFDGFFNMRQGLEDFTRGNHAQFRVVDFLYDIGAQAGGRRGAGFALHRVGQPAAHDGDLLFEIVGQGVEVMDDVLRHQQRGGHFERHDLAVERIGLRQVCRRRIDGFQQLHQRRVAELARFFGQRNQHRAEAFQAFGFAGCVFGPGVLDIFEARARIVQRGFQRAACACALVCFGQKTVEAKAGADLAQARRHHARARNGVEHIAMHQAGVGIGVCGKVA